MEPDGRLGPDPGPAVLSTLAYGFAAAPVAVTTVARVGTLPSRVPLAGMLLDRGVEEAIVESSGGDSPG